MHIRIQPTSGWRLIDWRELLAYRDLFWFLAMRDVKVRYKQTVLGFGWAVLRPLVTMMIFSVVFGRLAGVPSDGVPYPLFSLTALTPWIYFTAVSSTSTQSLVSNGAMLTRIYIPRLILPMAPVLAGLVDFSISLLLLLSVMALFGVFPTSSALLLPLLVAIMMLTATGMGLWLSALAVKYRDIRHASHFVQQLLMYAAPVVWPVSLITEKYPENGELIRLAYGLYPMAGVIEGFRAALLGTTSMPWDLLCVGTPSACVLAFSGAFYFRRTERTFADVA